MGGVEVESQSFLTTALDGESRQVHTSASATGESPGTPLKNTLCQPQSLPGHFEEQMNVLPLPRTERRFLRPPARKLVTAVTTRFLLPFLPLVGIETDSPRPILGTHETELI